MAKLKPSHWTEKVAAQRLFDARKVSGSLTLTVDNIDRLSREAIQRKTHTLGKGWPSSEEKTLMFDSRGALRHRAVGV